MVFPKEARRSGRTGSFGRCRVVTGGSLFFPLGSLIPHVGGFNDLSTERWTGLLVCWEFSSNENTQKVQRPDLNPTVMNTD